MRAFRHRDFTIMWAGSFFSFLGSWVQNVAQGWLVYDLTNDKGMLALVAFLGMAPVSVIGPVAGVLVDTVNRRWLLIGTQLTFGGCALFLSFALWQDFIRVEHIMAAALVIGIASSIDMPARQSLVSTLVPREDVPAAVPVNAMAFNTARIIGPAIGGLFLYWFGAKVCYLVNGLSYFALIGAICAVRANLGARGRDSTSVLRLMGEGIRFTLTHGRLRPLFLLETTTAIFALFYLAQMPAIARDQLGLGEKGLGYAMTAIGVGAILGLLTVYRLSVLPVKGRVIKVAMTLMGLSLLTLSFLRNPALAYPVFAVLGASAVMQFNTTNTLFQLIAPEHLRGRVLSMHVWAIAGIGPFGTLALGWMASRVGLAPAFWVGGGVVLLAAAIAALRRYDFDSD